MRHRLVLGLPFVVALVACNSTGGASGADDGSPGSAPSVGTFGGRCMAGASKTQSLEVGGAVCTVASYAGHAQVVALDVDTGHLLRLSANVSDTGALPSGGGTKSAELLDVQALDVLTAQAASARTAGFDGEAASTASVLDVKAAVAGIGITADTLRAVTHAACGGATTGSSVVQGLKVAGASVTVTGAPNQTLELPLVKIVINEQIQAANGSLTVNALHVSAPSVGVDLVVSSATSGIDCSCNGSSSGASGSTSSSGGSTSSSGASGSTSSSGGSTSSSGASGSTSSSGGSSGSSGSSGHDDNLPSSSSSSGGSSSGDGTPKSPGQLGDTCDDEQPCAEGYHCSGTAPVVR